MGSIVRQSVSLPAELAEQVKDMAKKQRISTNRALVELFEQGIEAKKQQEEEFFALMERFRATTDPEEAAALSEELGRMVFGG